MKKISYQLQTTELVKMVGIQIPRVWKQSNLEPNGIFTSTFNHVAWELHLPSDLRSHFPHFLNQAHKGQPKSTTVKNKLYIHTY